MPLLDHRCPTALHNELASPRTIIATVLHEPAHEPAPCRHHNRAVPFVRPRQVQKHHSSRSDEIQFKLIYNRSRHSDMLKASTSSRRRRPCRILKKSTNGAASFGHNMPTEEFDAARNSKVSYYRSAMYDSRHVYLKLPGNHKVFNQTRTVPIIPIAV